MSLPVTICCHVYVKSCDVIGRRSLHCALSLISYVTFWGGPGSSFGSPFSNTLGTYLPATWSNGRGRVCTLNVHVPHATPAQLAIQSAQSSSCSAAMVTVPFCALSGRGVPDDGSAPAGAPPLSV